MTKLIWRGLRKTQNVSWLTLGSHPTCLYLTDECFAWRLVGHDYFVVENGQITQQRHFYPNSHFELIGWSFPHM
jgi:hypothetical protein